MNEEFVNDGIEVTEEFSPEIDVLIDELGDATLPETEDGFDVCDDEENDSISYVGVALVLGAIGLVGAGAASLIKKHGPEIKDVILICEKM